MAPRVEAAILAVRSELRCGPHRLAALVGHPRSTVSKVLARRDAGQAQRPPGSSGCGHSQVIMGDMSQFEVVVPVPDESGPSGPPSCR